MIPKSIPPHRAFTLAEVVLTIGISSVALLSIAGLLGVSSNAARELRKNCSDLRNF